MRIICECSKRRTLKLRKLKMLTLRETKKIRPHSPESPKRIKKVKATVMVKKKSRERNGITTKMAKRVVKMNFQRATLVMKSPRNNRDDSNPNSKRRIRRNKTNKASSVPLRKY